MNEPRPDQRRILEDLARIRIVQAVPGSGKTWLIARELSQTLSRWRDQHRGIAALSFTNAARDEIQKAVGLIPSHPHFVGTLDAFIFRYIVQPFAHLYEPALRHLKLVPGEYAEALAEQQKWLPNSTLHVQVGADVQTKVNVFTANFLEEVDGSPVFSGKTSPWEPFRRIEGLYAQRVMAKKREVWSRSRVSHSDTAYLALELLRGSSGSEILRLLSRRFPILIVDELQDTGWYMGQVLREILDSTECMALLVGDPDQAIFEFSGATPTLFSRFSDLQGSKKLEMNYSGRCPQSVRRLAERLASENRTIDGPDVPGCTTLAIYSGDGYNDLRSFCRRLDENKTAYSLVFRRNSEIARLRAGKNTPWPKFASRPLQNLYRAVLFLESGKPEKALALADSSLSQAAFMSGHMDEATLRERGIDPFDWRCALIQILTEAYRRKEKEYFYEWGIRQKESIIGTLSSRGWNIEKKPRAPAKKLQGQWAQLDQDVSNRAPAHISTIHGAKGQTHEATVFFVPKKNAKDCPSSQWWEADSEERRIAYVAATRAKKAFVLCVHDEVFARLNTSRPDFVGHFEVCRLDDLNPDWD